MVGTEVKRGLILSMALIWVTGPSGAGKSTIGASLRDEHQVAHVTAFLARMTRSWEIVFKAALSGVFLQHYELH